MTLAGGLSGESHFLYYPYQENMKDKVTASATSDEEFFAPLINGWQPEADQSNFHKHFKQLTGMTPNEYRKQVRK